jgi:RNA polymerase sigma-70 factor (ECF subfamily)
MHPDDLVLIEGIRAGDHKAFTTLYTGNYPKLYKSIFRWTKNKENAEDVLQDTFTTAYVHLDAFHGTSRLSTWLYTIARRHFLMSIRPRKIDKRPVVIISIEDLSENRKNIVLENQCQYKTSLLIEVLEGAAELTPKRKKFLNLYLAGYTHSEIASITNSTVSATKALSFSTKESMRKSLNARPIRFRKRSSIQ